MMGMKNGHDRGYENGRWEEDETEKVKRKKRGKGKDVFGGGIGKNNGGNCGSSDGRGMWLWWQ